MAKQIKVLDGGFSTQLKNYVKEEVDGDPLWTAKYLATQPETCTLVHRDYAKAGADIITTATYQASIEGFKSLMFSESSAKKIMENSVQLVKDGIIRALDKKGVLGKVKIAGSVGPYGACLHDGSEYNGSYRHSVTTETFMDWHRPRIEALIEGGVNYLAVETIPCINEALAIIKLLEEEFPHAQAWISFSIKDSESISSGEDFCEAVAKCWAASNQLVAVGANCFHPSLVSKLFEPLKKQYPDIPTIVYTNNGDHYDVANKRWINKGGNEIEEYIPEWLDLGFSIIGGCCRTDSDNISNIKKLLQSKGLH